jgi:hypothetical protein
MSDCSLSGLGDTKGYVDGLDVQPIAYVLSLFIALGITFIGIREWFQPSIRHADLVCHSWSEQIAMSLPSRRAATSLRAQSSLLCLRSGITERSLIRCWR